ncbi:MAG: NosD domain-containing protein, partial [Ignavibacteriaceae bacterium]
MPLARDRLETLGFNYIYDNTNTNITSDTDEVIGYSSHGYYAFWDSSYILTQLQFDYSNGALFNSWESGNALSYGKWHWIHGLLSDFIVMDGSGGGGNANEPLQPGVYREGDSYPAYAMGYSIVDAIYQGINFIAWQNDIIGDPLETIAWGKQTLTQDVTWSGTNLVTGIIKIPSGKTLTIANDAVINFKHDGALEVEDNGTLTIQPGVALNFYNSSSIVVEGTLDVQGSSSNKVTFDRAESSGTWGSIIFDGSTSSGSSIGFANITYSSDLQCLNGADVTIENSIIENCTNGIYIYNSQPDILNNQIIEPTNNGIYGEASGKQPLIKGNVITRTSSKNYQGIWFTNYTQPFITNNDISGFYHAVYLGGGTLSSFTNAGVTSDPNNRLRDSRYGLTTGWGSTTLAGVGSNYGGNNSIYNNSSR